MNRSSDDSPQTNEVNDRNRACVDWGAARVAIVFGILAITMAVATVTIEWWRSSDRGDTTQSSAGSLAGLLLFGVLTFFFALAALIGVFRALNISEKGSALGMPQGSIRAFMALVLIMLFFLMAVFLYLDVARTGTERRLTGISQSSYEQVIAGGQVVSAISYMVPDPENPEQEVQRWDVVLRAARERSEVAEELARQLITVLGTLIVAIAAFYFGTNSVQAARRSEAKDALEWEAARRTESEEAAEDRVVEDTRERPIPPPAG
jgi:hypothetical protein